MAQFQLGLLLSILLFGGEGGTNPSLGSTAIHIRGDTGLVQHMTGGRLLHGKIGWLLGISTQFNEIL